MKKKINEEVIKMQEMAGIKQKVTPEKMAEIEKLLNAEESILMSLINSGKMTADQAMAALKQSIERFEQEVGQSIDYPTIEETDSIEEAQAPIPDNIKRFAQRKGLMAQVRQVANWAGKAGKRIVGGTAIGKNYNTLILDLTHNGSEVYIDADTEEITVYDMPVQSYDQFVNALQSKED